MNDDSRGMYNAHSQIKSKTVMFKSSFCDYSDAYMLVKGPMKVPNTAVPGAAGGPNNRGKN